jgi:hypothetical protein
MAGIYQTARVNRLQSLCSVNYFAALHFYLHYNCLDTGVEESTVGFLPFGTHGTEEAPDYQIFQCIRQHLYWPGGEDSIVGIAICCGLSI